MKEVTQDQFYQFIGPLDVTVGAIGNYPYTTEFRMRRSRELMGKVVENYSDELEHHYPIVKKYFINN